jgi:hypothetical protein
MPVAVHHCFSLIGRPRFRGRGDIIDSTHLRRKIPAMHMPPRVSQLLLTMILLAGTACAKPDTEARQAIDRIEARPSYSLYDEHGNSNEELLRLKLLRFDATAALMTAIDRLEATPQESGIRDALIRTLGFIMDPASIDWLDSKRLEPAPDAFFDAFLIGWLRHPELAGTSPWLTGRAEWIAFWTRMFEEETSSDRRVQVLSVLAGFDDDAVTAFFRDLFEASSDGREILTAAAYLDAHELPIRDDRVRYAIDALAGPTHFEFVAGLAYDFRHEALVPYLIDHADTTVYYTSGYPAQLPLECITYRQDIDDKAGWQAWYAAHGKQTRPEWRDAKLAELRELLDTDVAAAATWFDRGVYVLAEIDLLDFIETELEPHDAFRSNLAGWVNLTYTPFLRERLRPLAQRLARRPELLEEHALRLLERRNYIEGQAQATWADEVRSANRRL